MQKTKFVLFLALIAMATSLAAATTEAADMNVYGGRAACIRLCKTDNGTGCDLKRHPDHPGVCAEQQRECIKACPRGKVSPGYG